MQKKKQELMKFFKINGGVVRFSAILKAGFHPDSLNILEREEKVEKVSRGLYKLRNYDIGVHPDLVMASLQAPRGIVCLLSALYFHEATIEIPKYVDMAIPYGTHAYRIQYPPVKFYRFDSKTWQAGVEVHEIKGCKIKVYSLAKTIADCFKFRNRIGINVVRESLKAAMTEKDIEPKEIMEYAKICRVDSIVKPILETIL